MLTAHPTEATRRTVLASHLRIAALLAELDDPLLAPARRTEIEASLAAEITAHWQADEVRSRRPRVVDEIRNGHWFFEQSLIDASERLLADYRRLLPGAPAPLRWGTWIGGDANGESGRWVPARFRRRTLKAGAADAPAPLPGQCAASSRQRRSGAITPDCRRRRPARVSQSAATERELAEYADEIGDQNRDEPYRRKLSFMWRRLDADAYASADDLAEDLAVIDRSLRANRGARIADGALARSAAPGQLFSLHTARKTQTRSCTHPPRPRRKPDRRIRGMAEAVADARRRHGPQALDTWIVSGTDSAEDVRRVHELTDEPLSVVPLFESVDALRARRASTASCSTRSAAAR